MTAPSASKKASQLSFPRHLQELKFRCESRPFVQVRTLNSGLDTLSFEFSQELTLGVSGQILYADPTQGICWLEGTVIACTPVGKAFRVNLLLEFRSLSDRLPYQRSILQWSTENQLWSN